MEWRAARVPLSHCWYNGWFHDVLCLQFANAETRSNGPVGYGLFQRLGERSLLSTIRFRRLEAWAALVPELLRCLGVLDDFVS